MLFSESCKKPRFYKQCILIWPLVSGVRVCVVFGERDSFFYQNDISGMFLLFWDTVEDYKIFV